MLTYQVLFWFISIVSLSHCWSPTDSYAPGRIECPSSDILRVADSISKEESDWLKGRDEVTNEKIVEFLKYANMTDIDPEDYGKLNRSIHIGDRKSVV